MLSSYPVMVTGVISLMIPDDVVKERIAHRALLEGRADDARDEVVNNRIVTYHHQTEPLIDYYKDRQKYHEVDSLGTIAQVGENIRNLMDSLA